MGVPPNWVHRFLNTIQAQQPRKLSVCNIHTFKIKASFLSSSFNIGKFLPLVFHSVILFAGEIRSPLQHFVIFLGCFLLVFNTVFFFHVPQRYHR